MFKICLYFNMIIVIILKDMVSRETYKARGIYCLQLLRLLEIPKVSLHIFIFLKQFEQQTCRRAWKREMKLDMISGVRKRLSLLTRGNWNQKESKIFRGGEQGSYKERWQGELGQQEKIKTLLKLLLDRSYKLGKICASKYKLSEPEVSASLSS